MDSERISQAILSLLDIDMLLSFITKDPPWWIFVVMALIPLSLLLIAREMWCWFFKINRRLRLLEEILFSLEEQRYNKGPANGQTKND